MDKHLLDILCCPVSKSPLRPLSETELAALNRAITTDGVANKAGARVTEPFTAGLITRDARTIYRVQDDIPLMLADGGIASEQIAAFPR